MWKNILLFVVFCCFFKFCDNLEDLKKRSWNLIALEIALENRDSRKMGLKPLSSRRSKNKSSSFRMSNFLEHRMKILCMWPNISPLNTPGGWQEWGGMKR